MKTNKELIQEAISLLNGKSPISEEERKKISSEIIETLFSSEQVDLDSFLFVHGYIMGVRSNENN